jgi:hypothetical protein
MYLEDLQNPSLHSMYCAVTCFAVHLIPLCEGTAVETVDSETENWPVSGEMCGELAA